jgi:zinc/manganese transport system substrate-binding protein
MSNKRLLPEILISILLISMIVPACAQQDSGKIDVVCTTSVLMDPVIYIGGDRVAAISIADPALCPDVQSDIIPSRIQLNAKFIQDADMFVAFNDTNDRMYNIPAVNKYMAANNYGNVTWYTISDPSAGWNTPTTSKALAAQVKGWLESKDPMNASYYEQNYNAYLKTFDAIEPTAAEKQALNKTSVIVMMWQEEPVESWLGMNVVSVFAPTFVMNGSRTADKVVDDINKNPDKYKNVSYVIENMQSGDLAKGIEESLHDHGINATRVSFTNFPYSVPNTTTMADVLNYNKHLVLAQSSTATTATTATSATPAPIGIEVVVAGLLIGAVMLLRKADR